MKRRGIRGLSDQEIDYEYHKEEIERCGRGKNNLS